MRSSWVGLRMRKLRSLARIPIRLRPRSTTASPTGLVPPSEMLRATPATCPTFLDLVSFYNTTHLQHAQLSWLLSLFLQYHTPATCPTFLALVSSQYHTPATCPTLLDLVGLFTIPHTCNMLNPPGSGQSFYNTTHLQHAPLSTLVSLFSQYHTLTTQIHVCLCLFSCFLSCIP